MFVDWDESIILVEGLFDAIVAGQNAIPILGSTLREESKLFQGIVLNDSPVYLALDEDARKKQEYIIKTRTTITTTDDIDIERDFLFIYSILLF